MRCKGCNKILTSEEMVLKDSDGCYEGMCITCLTEAGVDTLVDDCLDELDGICWED